jgi:serine/threonine-protein kinase
MLYELLTGRLPFEGETALQVLMRHVQEPPPPPSQFGPIHPELERLVLRTLAKKPADRPSTARDVADELLLLLGDIEAHSVERWQRFSTAPTSPPPPPPRESVPPTANPAPIDEAGLQPSATPGDLPSERAYTEPVEAPPRLDTNIPRPPRPAPRRGTQRLAHPFVGKVLAGRFEVRSLVREGSVSQIFTGVSEQEPRHVAIKVLNPEHASEDEVAQRFVRAGEAASHFRHPNIVRTHLAAVEEGLPFVVMELLFGDDLSGRIRQRGSLSQDAAVHIAVQTCKALAHAHQLGIVHRDLKPENLMLCRQPSDPSREIVKVIDFGTAKIFDENSKLIPPGGARGRQIVTRVGALIGSPAYISPEQARSGPTDARSDIYSLGVVLYELLTGRTPFAGQRPIELVAQHLNDAPPPPSTFAPVPRELERIVLRCLEKSPDDRPQSAIELAAHLETALYDIAKAAVSERMMRWRRRVSPLPAELMPVALAAISASSPTIAAVSEASVPPTQLAAGHLEPTASPATEQPAQRSASTSSPPVDPEALAPESHAPRLDASARALATTVLAPASARPHSVPPAPLSTAPASLTSGAASALPPPQSFPPQSLPPQSLPPQSLPPQSLPPQSLPPRVSEEAAHDRSSSLASRDAADIARLSRLVTVLGAVLAVTLVALGVVVFLLLRR